MGSSKTRRILRFVTEHKDYTLNLRHYLDIKSLVQLAQIFDLDKRSGCFVVGSRIATIPNDAGPLHRYTLLSKSNHPSHLYRNRLLDIHYLRSRLRCGSRSSTGLSCATPLSSARPVKPPSISGAAFQVVLLSVAHGEFALKCTSFHCYESRGTDSLNTRHSSSKHPYSAPSQKN